MTDHIERLRGLLEKATPGPWVGDRFDGTVKYVILGGPERVRVCVGDNGNSDDGPYGFNSSNDEALVMAMRNAFPALLAIAEAAREDREDMAVNQSSRMSQALANLEKLPNNPP